MPQPFTLFQLQGIATALIGRRSPGLMAPRMPVTRGRTPLPLQPRLTISGVTRDSNNAVLGSCSCDLIREPDDVRVQTLVSDPTTGAYSFDVVGIGQTYRVDAYKVGSPDVAGTTMNTIQGSP